MICIIWGGSSFSFSFSDNVRSSTETRCRQVEDWLKVYRTVKPVNSLLAVMVMAVSLDGSKGGQVHGEPITTNIAGCLPDPKSQPPSINTGCWNQQWKGLSISSPSLWASQVHPASHHVTQNARLDRLMAWCTVTWLHRTEAIVEKSQFIATGGVAYLLQQRNPDSSSRSCVFKAGITEDLFIHLIYTATYHTYMHMIL